MDKSLVKVVFPNSGKCTLTPAQKKKITLGVLEGLSYLHDNGVVHGDLKLENVLVTKDFKGIKLCDMGLSRLKQSSQGTVTVASNILGTIMYMAPEMLLGLRRTTKATDVWAAAGMIVELYALCLLWVVPSEDTDLQQYIMAAMEENAVPDGLQNLHKYGLVFEALKPCFAYEPQERPSAQDLVKKFIDL